MTTTPPPPMVPPDDDLATDTDQDSAEADRRASQGENPDAVEAPGDNEGSQDSADADYAASMGEQPDDS